MLPYWILFAMFAAGAIVVQRPDHGQSPSRPVLIVAAVLMTVFIGLRYEVGPDWVGYQYIFQDVNRHSLATAIAHGDPGFTALVWLAKDFGLEIWAVNLACAAIFVTGLVRFAKQQSSPWLAIAVAIPYLVIVIAMSTTRQATAIGFILIGLAAFAEKSVFRFVVWTFIAALFHASALLVLPIVGLSYTRNRFQSVLLICLTAIPAYYLLAANFEIYINRYSGGYAQSEGASYRVAMNAVAAIIFLIFKNRFTTEHHIKTLWRNLSVLALTCIPLLVLFPSSTALDRAALYIMPLQIYALSNFPVIMSNNRNEYLVMVLIILGYLAAILLVYLNFSVHGKYYVPYRIYPIV